MRRMKGESKLNGGECTCIWRAKIEFLHPNCQYPNVKTLLIEMHRTTFKACMQIYR